MGTDDVSTKKKGLRVIRIKASNLRCFKAFDVKLPRNIVVIAGKNEAGKTTILDAVKMAIEGGSQDHRKAIRHGTKRLDISVDIGDTAPLFTASKVVTNSGERLEVRPVGCDPIKSPQTYLDDFPGALTFDPGEFDRMKGAKRIATLMDLGNLRAPLDKIDAERSRLFNGRHGVNRALRDAEGELRNIPKPDENAPTEEVEIQPLLEEKNRRQVVIDENNKVRSCLRSAEEDVTRAEERIDETNERLEQARRAVEQAEEAVKEATTELRGAEYARDDLKREAQSLADPNLTEVDARILDAQTTNKLVTRVRQFQAAVAKVEKLTTEAEGLTGSIASCDQDKTELLATANFPIPGLSFDGDDVLLNGTHWSELSRARRMRVSFAIGMALNPTLELIGIEDASLLDDESYATICAEALKHDYQAILEVVGDDHPDACIVIEDGAVKQKVAANG